MLENFRCMHTGMIYDARKMMQLKPKQCYRVLHSEYRPTNTEQCILSCRYSFVRRYQGIPSNYPVQNTLLKAIGVCLSSCSRTLHASPSTTRGVALRRRSGWEVQRLQPSCYQIPLPGNDRNVLLLSSCA